MTSSICFYIVERKRGTHFRMKTLVALDHTQNCLKRTWCDNITRFRFFLNYAYAATNNWRNRVRPQTVHVYLYRTDLRVHITCNSNIVIFAHGLLIISQSVQLTVHDFIIKKYASRGSTAFTII